MSDSNVKKPENSSLRTGTGGVSEKDVIYRQDAIDAVNNYLKLSEVSRTVQNTASIQEVLQSLPSAQPEKCTEERTETHACDLIDRQAAIDALRVYFKKSPTTAIRAMNVVESQPSVEPLTDKEQRIFLAAMAREMKVCEEVDRNYTREPYEDSLVRVCREIERKVKGALWT